MRADLKRYRDKAKEDWRKLEMKVRPLFDKWDDEVGLKFQEEFWQQYEETVPEYIEAIQLLQERIDMAIGELEET